MLHKLSLHAKCECTVVVIAAWGSNFAVTVPEFILSPSTLSQYFNVYFWNLADLQCFKCLTVHTSAV